MLSIDADEVLSDELRRSIIALKAEGFRHRMYCFRVVSYVCGHPVAHSGMQPAVETRLFDKRYASWDLLDVGERLTYAGSINPQPLQGDLLHFRCSEISELHFKELRHAELRGRLMAAAGIDARAACAFMKCHLSDGAILDGATGHDIAKTRFIATLHAYRTSRKIIKGGK